MLTVYLLSQKHIRPFAKRSILRDYLRYIPAFSRSARTYIPGLSEKERIIVCKKFSLSAQFFISRLSTAKNYIYFGLMATSLIVNVRFCPASAWFSSRVIVAAVTLITFTELSEPSMVLRTE
jgi:hypothetical protein